MPSKMNIHGEIGYFLTFEDCKKLGLVEGRFDYRWRQGHVVSVKDYKKLKRKHARG